MIGVFSQVLKDLKRITNDDNQSDVYGHHG